MSLSYYRLPTVARRIAAHYGAPDIEPVLPQLRDTLFQSMEPMPERHFVAEMRQALLAALLGGLLAIGGGLAFAVYALRLVGRLIGG